MSRATNSFLTVATAVLLASFAYSAYHGHRLSGSAAQVPLVMNVRMLPYYAIFKRSDWMALKAPTRGSLRAE